MSILSETIFAMMPTAPVNIEIPVACKFGTMMMYSTFDIYFHDSSFVLNIIIMVP